METQYALYIHYGTTSILKDRDEYKKSNPIQIPMLYMIGRVKVSPGYCMAESKELGRLETVTRHRTMPHRINLLIDPYRKDGHR